jgi:glycosyltransferase involved in cell wall biosynthesis
VRDGYRVIRRAGRYLVFPRAALAELTGRHGPTDALFEIWNGMPFFSPLWFRGPKVVMLHHVHAEMWRMVLGEDAPWLADLGNTLEGRVAPFVYRRTRVVTPSDSSKAEIVELLALRPELVSVVNNGTDAAFTPGGRKARTPVAIAVGRLVPVKRYDLLLRAVAHARETVPELTLTIVGEGYERPRLDEVVRDLDAERWVTFAGRVSQDELVRLYRRAWLVVSSSAREGWGLSLTEAAACGTPAVATRISGHADAVADGRSGLLVDGTPEALADAMTRVATDADLRHRLAAGAVSHASQFSWDATAYGITQVLAAEVERSHRRR